MFRGVKSFREEKVHCPSHFAYITCKQQTFNPHNLISLPLSLSLSFSLPYTNTQSFQFLCRTKSKKMGMVMMESKVECCEHLSEMGDDSSMPLKTSKTSSLIPHGDNKHGTEISIRKNRSFEMETDQSTIEKLICRRKTFSAQFPVNVDELINNNITNPGSLDESNGFFQIPPHKVPDDDISSAISLQAHGHKDSALAQYSSVDEEDPNSSSWRNMHIRPTLPIYLKFEGVKYKVASVGENDYPTKAILHGITGSVRPGEVLALMGPSGGGKTTLLNLLSGRFKIKSGTITYNDYPYMKSLKQRIGFVLQDDIVFPHLTVKETLTYAALLRLPNTLTKEQKKERAMDVINELGLERCQNTAIGGALVKGISGGERKRVCIGNEILLNPSLLFLDEPTSGLDSTTALRIIQMLHNIAEAGMTVVTTIHQPSSRLFSKFDKLILLGNGSSLYFGKASEAMLYFSSIGCAPLIAMNPAEFLIDLANGNTKNKSVPSELNDKFRFQIKDKDLSSMNLHEYLVGAHDARIQNSVRPKLLKPLKKIEGSNSREWQATWWEQFSILFTRGLKERRHEYLSRVRVIQVISTAIVVGLLWWHSESSAPNRHQDLGGLLFFISVFWTFYPIFTAIFTFSQERVMLAKERSVGMYRLSAYFMARNTSDLPLDLIMPVLFMLIVYFMAGLKPSFSSFTLTLLTVFLSIVAAQGLGLAIGAAFMDIKQATTLASVIVMTFMLCGGFFVHNVPSFVSWLRCLSFNYHTYKLLLKIQCSNPESESGSCDSPPIKGQRIGSGGSEVGAMVVMIVAYRILAYLFLRRMRMVQ